MPRVTLPAVPASSSIQKLRSSGAKNAAISSGDSASIFKQLFRSAAVRLLKNRTNCLSSNVPSEALNCRTHPMQQDLSKWNEVVSLQREALWQWANGEKRKVSFGKLGGLNHDCGYGWRKLNKASSAAAATEVPLSKEPSHTHIHSRWTSWSDLAGLLDLQHHALG